MVFMHEVAMKFVLLRVRTSKNIPRATLYVQLEFPIAGALHG
jgi:hypothetical protein